MRPYGIGVATGEHCHNRVMFKQLLQSNAMQYCQIDSCRLAGPNEILSVYLMAAKFNGEYLYWRVHWLAVWFTGNALVYSGPVSAWMGDRIRAGKLSRYVTSHQLSLAIPLWVGAMSTSLGWEGNRRSGVALAMRHRQ